MARCGFFFPPLLARVAPRLSSSTARAFTEIIAEVRTRSKIGERGVQVRARRGGSRVKEPHARILLCWRNTRGPSRR